MLLGREWAKCAILPLALCVTLSGCGRNRNSGPLASSTLRPRIDINRLLRSPVEVDEEAAEQAANERIARQADDEQDTRLVGADEEDLDADIRTADQKRPSWRDRLIPPLRGKDRDLAEFGDDPFLDNFDKIVAGTDEPVTAEDDEPGFDLAGPTGADFAPLADDDSTDSISSVFGEDSEADPGIELAQAERTGSSDDGDLFKPASSRREISTSPDRAAADVFDEIIGSGEQALAAADEPAAEKPSTFDELFQGEPAEMPTASQPGFDSAATWDGSEGPEFGDVPTLDQTPTLDAEEDPFADFQNSEESLADLGSDDSASEPLEIAAADGPRVAANKGLSVESGVSATEPTPIQVVDNGRNVEPGSEPEFGPLDSVPMPSINDQASQPAIPIPGGEVIAPAQTSGESTKVATVLPDVRWESNESSDAIVRAPTEWTSWFLIAGTVVVAMLLFAPSRKR